MWKKISLPKLGIDRSLLSDIGQKLHIQCCAAKQIQHQQQKKEKREAMHLTKGFKIRLWDESFDL